MLQSKSRVFKYFNENKIVKKIFVSRYCYFLTSYIFIQCYAKILKLFCFIVNFKFESKQLHSYKTKRIKINKCQEDIVFIDIFWKMP